jgi:hypothetical protein
MAARYSESGWLASNMLTSGTSISTSATALTTTPARHSRSRSRAPAPQPAQLAFEARQVVAFPLRQSCPRRQLVNFTSCRARKLISEIS